MLFKSKKVKELEEIVEAYRQERSKLLEQINSYKNNIKEKDRRITNLTDDNNLLLKENNKLLEWISKIINEVNVYTVNSDMKITLPIYKRTDEIGFADGELYCHNEIILPEIHLHNMTNK